MAGADPKNTALRRYRRQQNLLRGPTCSLWPFTRNASSAALSRLVDTLTDKTDILNRWAEHYGTLFGDVRSVEDASIDNIQQRPVKPELDESPFLEEVQTSVKKMKVHKAPGIYDLPVVVYKLGGDKLLEKLTSIFTLCWKKGVVQGNLRDAVIVSLYKNK